MRDRQYLSSLAAALLLLLAGCAGIDGASTPTSNTTTTDASDSPANTPTVVSKTPLSSPEFDRSTALERATEHEAVRIENALDNTSGISGVSVGVYGTSNAEIIDTSSTAYTVRVTMSYSYEYECDGESGAVDGQTTKTVYRVTQEATTLKSTERAAQSRC